MRITVVINAPRFSSEENRTYTFYDRGSAYFFYHKERERMGNRFMGGCAYDENHMNFSVKANGSSLFWPGPPSIN